MAEEEEEHVGEEEEAEGEEEEGEEEIQCCPHELPATSNAHTKRAEEDKEEEQGEGEGGGGGSVSVECLLSITPLPGYVRSSQLYLEMPWSSSKSVNVTLKPSSLPTTSE